MVKLKTKMRAIGVVLQIFFFVLVLVEAGCEPMPVTIESQDKTDSGFNVSVYSRYSPARVDILPLTEFVGVNGDEEVSKIRVYVGLLDSFGCQMKAPGVFRFELYKRVVRSAEPKGRRVAIWPDIDLTEPSENNNYWRDFLRAYEFELDFEAGAKQSYILEVTCLCPNGRRLLADLALKNNNRQ